MLAEELKKYKPRTAALILLYHFKPGFFEVLQDQLAALQDKRLQILHPADEFHL